MHMPQHRCRTACWRGLQEKDNSRFKGQSASAGDIAGDLVQAACSVHHACSHSMTHLCPVPQPLTTAPTAPRLHNCSHSPTPSQMRPSPLKAVPQLHTSSPRLLKSAWPPVWLKACPAAAVPSQKRPRGGIASLVLPHETHSYRRCAAIICPLKPQQGSFTGAQHDPDM